jgi:methenyltetrahydrofolate cyclohydrolase
MRQPFARVEPLDLYLERLASAEPVPGGGSAAATVGALAAALLAMVGRISARNPAHAQLHDLAAALASRADELRIELAQARRRDEIAYEAVVAAQALPKGDAAQAAARRGALEAALENAAREPLRAAGLALELLRLAVGSFQIPNRNLASDVGCAAEFAYAALAACAYNVRVNHRFVQDRNLIADQEQRLKAFEGEASELLAGVRSAVAPRLART